MPDQRRQSVLTFPPLLRALHWATAALMVAVVVLAWSIPDGPGQGGSVLMLHKSVGLTILALTVLRLFARRAAPPPAEDAATTRLEALAATATHVLLYVVLVAMPVSGFLFATADGHPVSLFGLVTLPSPLPPSAALRSAAWVVHGGGQYAVYAAVGLHVAAALYHLLVRRDGVMARMWPGAARFTGAARPLLATRPAAR
jgi:cytochrome b561